ncbi:MAG: 2-hydroxyacyl-CoA dehydratase, partial [Thermoplasmata archaeon]|nr:2-hydroxyacyl-CoA dehydratase [Thermoplasmata archaeon]
MRIGITTTVPIEPFLASGNEVVDLNNLFIGERDPSTVVEEAQVIGYPRNICSWIKGLYAKSLEMDGVVGVVHGDCSNTESLLDTLRLKDVSVHPFSYPSGRERNLLVGEIESLCSYLGTTIEDASLKAERVEGLRSLARKVDELRWKKLNVSADDAFRCQLSTSDFDSNPERWERWVEGIISDAGGRDEGGPRLAMIGVPPIITDLISTVEGLGGRLIFFETARQFTMPFTDGDWIDRYLEYTYPYSIQGRIDDIIEQIRMRKVDG